MERKTNECRRIGLQIVISLLTAWFFTDYMRFSKTSIIILPIALGFYFLQRYVNKNKSEFQDAIGWYLFFSMILSLVLVLCRHMVVDFYDSYSDITKNYITSFSAYDLLAYIFLVYAVMMLSFVGVKIFSRREIRGLIISNNEENKGLNVGIKNIKELFLIALLLLICWLPYWILYYPALIYGDSTLSIAQILGQIPYNNQHPFMYTMLLKGCLFLGNLIGGNTIGCAIYSIIQMIYMAMIFSYSICWLKNKNVSSKICFIVFLFFALSRFWGQHAVSVWKDPIFALTLYFYSLKLFDLIYSKGEVSKEKKYILECVISVILICFSRNNGIYAALFSLAVMIVCTFKDICKGIVKKRIIIYTLLAIVFSWGIQGPVYKHFGIFGSATGAYGVPLQQVARTVVYDGNISESELEFLNKIMPLEKYRDNYSPGLVDHIKWSQDFNTEFFAENHNEFMKVWLSLLFKNPKIYFEAWELNTCGFWGLSYWELNDFKINVSMGVPRENEELEYHYGVTSGSLLKNAGDIEKWLKKYFSLETPMPSVSVCIWITLFMVLVAIVKGKWQYLLLFVPCFGNLITLLIASPITYWPRYGLSSICLLPISLLFPYLIEYNSEK